MRYTQREIDWMKKDPENQTDMPRDAKDWDKLAYRSIGWNPATKRWEYFTRPVEVEKKIVHYDYTKLSDLILVTNRIHKIDDEVERNEFGETQ